MKLLYLVHNGDGVMVGTFETSEQAKAVVKEIGVKCWKEKWVIEIVELNCVNSWLLLPSKLNDLGIKASKGKV